MDANENNINYGQGEQQPRKRKFNELSNDGQPSAAGEEQQEPAENLSKKNCEHQQGNQDLEFESLSREDLLKLVRKSAKQTEEFSQRIVQLEQEKTEVQEHEHLNRNLAEIVELHKEVEEKSGQLTEKTKQIDALLIQLNESTSHHPLMPTEQEMKIQLSLETWYDWLGFVPRHQLGQIVPKIGDRRFASIAQKFLHQYGEITIDRIQIVAPYEEYPDDHPRVRLWQNNRLLRYEIAEAQMPANIKNFTCFALSYFDQSVLNFMQKFQQNGLLDNVNLQFAKIPPTSKVIVQQVLGHLLPLINGIRSINMVDSAQLIDFYDAGNSKEIYERNMKMMAETRILALTLDYDRKNLHANIIDLYCCWLYQTAHADSKPRELLLFRMNVDSAPIALFIDRLKQDFLMATNPTTFLIRIVLPKGFEPSEEICLENDNTKERFRTEIEIADPNLITDSLVLLISRYPLASTRKWIVGKEIYEKRIYLSEELKVVAI